MQRKDGLLILVLSIIPSIAMQHHILLSQVVVVVDLVPLV
jgi:hypothetical protein